MVAVDVARFALDRVIRIEEGTSTVFNNYKMLDESTARYRDHPRYGGLDLAHQLVSATDEQLLVTIAGYVQYRTLAFLEAAVGPLQTGGWLDERQRWRVDGHVSEHDRVETIDTDQL